MDRDAVAECSDEVGPEVDSAPSVAVGFFEDAEDLEPPYDMLHRQSDLSESSVIGPLGVGERVMLARLLWCSGVGMLMLNPLIPSVGEEFGVGMDGRLRLPQEPKIMRCPASGGHAEDPVRDRMHQELQF